MSLSLMRCFAWEWESGVLLTGITVTPRPRWANQRGNTNQRRKTKLLLFLERLLRSKHHSRQCFSSSAIYTATRKKHRPPRVWEQHLSQVGTLQPRERTGAMGKGTWMSSPLQFFLLFSPLHFLRWILNSFCSVGDIVQRQSKSSVQYQNFSKQ